MELDKKPTLVVLNAGEASRLRPITSNCSKAMVPVNGRPVLDYIIDAFGEGEVGELIVVQNKRHDDAERYVRRRGYTFPSKFVTQLEPKGPRDAVRTALCAMTDERPVVVWYGDTLLAEPVPSGTTFFATHLVPDQSEWMIWDSRAFTHRPATPLENGRAFIGVFGCDSSDRLRAAVNMSYEYDVERVLELIGAAEHHADAWYDIGVPSRYYTTCASLLNTKARAFNRFHYDPDTNVLTKTAQGAAALTLEAEAAWYAGLSPEQALFAPRLVYAGLDQLRITYEPGTLLSDFSLYHDLTPSFWQYALRRLVKIVERFHSAETTRNFEADFAEYSREMWVEGVAKRLEKTDLLSASTKQFLTTAGLRVALSSRPVGAMHGDLHLSNVLYDQQTGKLTLIDPRGKYGRYVGCAGGDLYDWCKLAYDCVHGFSAIVAGAKPNPVVRDAFMRVLGETGLSPEVVLDGAAVLMATGIPLHYDNPRRQEGFAEQVESYVKSRTHEAAA